MISKNRIASLVALLIFLPTLFVTVAWSKQLNGRVPTVLTPDVAKGKFRTTIVVSARLTELISGRGIAGQRLNVCLMYADYTTSLGPAYTDNNGVAKATVNLQPYDIPATGTYRLGWYYTGNGVYSAPIPITTLTVTK